MSVDINNLPKYFYVGKFTVVQIKTISEPVLDTHLNKHYQKITFVDDLVEPKEFPTDYLKVHKVNERSFMISTNEGTILFFIDEEVFHESFKK